MHFHEVDAELLQKLHFRPRLGLRSELGPPFARRGWTFESRAGEHQTRPGDRTGLNRLPPLEILDHRQITEVVGKSLVAHVAYASDAVDDVPPEAQERQQLVLAHERVLVHVPESRNNVFARCISHACVWWNRDAARLAQVC